MRTRKYDYVWVIQGHYGQGWEDESVEFTRADARAQLNLYYENSDYPARMIQRRVLRETEIE
jgi:hypothetical protein